MNNRKDAKNNTKNTAEAGRTKGRSAERNATLRFWMGIITLVVVVANILFFAFRVTSALTFWIVIGLAAVIAWPIMNYLQNH